MEIKVCGPGCAKCHEAERVVKEALEESGVEASLEKISDFNEIAKLGVFSTPAVIIDGKVKCVGKVPTKKDVLSWMKSAGC
ncbi:MAG: thioredoxin family protein [Desulfobulbaceae bacterium]